MSRRFASTVALALFAGQGACGGGGGSAVQVRAAKDLDCPEEQVLLHDEGSCNIVASGCGKQAKYFVRPNAPESDVCCPPAGCDIRREGAVRSQ